MGFDSVTKDSVYSGLAVKALRQHCGTDVSMYDNDTIVDLVLELE